MSVIMGDNDTPSQRDQFLPGDFVQVLSERLIHWLQSLFIAFYNKVASVLKLNSWKPVAGPDNNSAIDCERGNRFSSGANAGSNGFK